MGLFGAGLSPDEGMGAKAFWRAHFAERGDAMPIEGVTVSVFGVVGGTAGHARRFSDLVDDPSGRAQRSGFSTLSPSLPNQSIFEVIATKCFRF